MSIETAFYKICTDHQAPQSVYVSLYVSVPYYGGPEEGGWWGSDCNLVSYQRCVTMEEAESLLEKINDLAEELSNEARLQFGRQCIAELEMADSRGIDYDDLPEVDGEEKYFAVIEETVGSLVSRGDRHYS